MDVMENESLAALDPQQRAELVPLQYFKVISDPELTDSQPALIFSRENLQVINRYVRTVKNLPRDKEELDDWLDFELLNLKADETHGLFEALRGHVETWKPLENETQAMGTTLEHFAETFTTQGAELARISRDMKAYKTRPLADVTDELLDKWAPVELDAGERAEVFATIEDLLHDLQKKINRVHVDIKNLSARATQFYEDVRTDLLPMVSRLATDLDDITRDSVVVNITNAMAELDGKIDITSAEISTFTNYQFFGMVFGPAGAIVTHAIFGSDAKAAKEQKNELLRQRDELGRSLDQVSPQLAQLKRLIGVMVDMKERLRQVNTASWNLQWVMRELLNRVNLSKIELTDIESDVKFERFVRAFSSVVQPWHRIGNISAELTQVFNDVVKNYDEE
nr:alpha-xenorhabdolysin family binary toxin subunit A [uncultured Pseudomonas sp.]